MSIRELLNAKATVSFELDGASHELEMVSPTASQAQELRAEFYRLGSGMSGEQPTPDMAVEFESSIARAVRACMPPDSDDASMSDDEMRLFLLRIGGDKSEVVRTALKWCGVNYDGDAVGDDGADSAAF